MVLDNNMQTKDEQNALLVYSKLFSSSYPSIATELDLTGKSGSLNVMKQS